MGYSVVLNRPQAVRLAGVDADETAGLKKEAGESALAGLGKEIARLQELLYAAGRQSVLIVLQGIDGSGKDGTVRSVMGYMNPQSCHVSSFKTPSAVEVAHDFLWRVHPHAPARGMVSVFNRSHYEDVLIVRVHDLVPEKVWRKRYEQINAFEELLAENDTLILKFFLLIDKEEQAKRLLAREEDPDKAWKLSVGDWKERARWDDYTAAYEEMLQRCSTAHAPWHVIPASHKWFRNLAVAEAVVECLRPHAKEWRSALEERGKTELAELRAMRESGEIA